MTRSRAAAVISVCALSGAAALWLNAGAQSAVTDAAPSPGVLELAASFIATWWPNLALGAVFSTWHAVTVIAAAALSALAVWRFTQSILASTAIGLIAAASPLMAPVLAPPSATALAIAAVAWIAVLDGSALGVVLSVTLASAIAPGLALPGALLCWWASRRAPGRGAEAKGIAAAVVCVGATAGLRLALPVLPGHTLTLSALRRMIPDFANAGGAIHDVAVALTGVGPLVLALATLGLFAVLFELRETGETVDRRRERAVLALGFPVATCIAALCPDADPVRTLAPLVIGLWLLAGRGLAEILVLCGAGWRQAGGVLVAAVMVLLGVEPRLNPRPGAADAAAQLGHETLTRRNFQALLYKLPPGSAVVAEDAVTDVLLRSLAESLRQSRNAISVIARTADAASHAHGAQRVFALPRAQTELQARGVRFVEGLVPAAPGIAEVAAVLPCDVTGKTWQTARAVSGVTKLALVADSDDAQGPLVVYVGGPLPMEATPLGWPPLALRGFYTWRYDRPILPGRLTLPQEIANDAAPAQHPAVTAPNVTRTELWRVPGAPLALTIEWSSPPTAAVAAELARATGTLKLCPVFPFDVRGFVK